MFSNKDKHGLLVDQMLSLKNLYSFNSFDGLMFIGICTLYTCTYISSTFGHRKYSSSFISLHSFGEIYKYQGVKEFHMLARIGCNCKIMVFSPFITYYHSSKGYK